MESQLKTRAEQEASRAQNFPAFSALSLPYVREQVEEALTAFGKFSMLEEYTKHDMSHIDSMLKMYDWLIPAATAEKMTAADWLLVTLATYLHDFGLLITRDEFDRREAVEGYTRFSTRVRDNDDPEYMDYRAQLNAMPGADAERFLYQEFVRANHAQRIRSWLREMPDPALGYDDRIVARLREIFGTVEETFLEDVGLVCESHHADDLHDTHKYRVDRPYGQDQQEEANVQYAAFLLRTADLLDITRTRVPSMAALIVNPRNPKSQLEWAKQSAVRSVRPQRVAVEEGDPIPELDVIEVHADFKESEGFFGLTQYLKYASDQLAETHRWASSSGTAAAKTYLFPWRRIDPSNVVAKGFVAEPFKFTIDQGKILDLLTGHTLYNDSSVVVRELFQNALDAVRLQEFLVADSAYAPTVQVSWDSASRMLTVADNGTGMTQSVIENNFLRVGSSRYQEPEFRKSHPDFTSISRFGIGVLTAFMVADDVEVISVNELEDQARQLTLRDVHGQYLVRLLDKTDAQVPRLVRKHGTSVRLKLRPSAVALNVESVLRYWCVLPGCAVTLSIDGGAPEPIGFQSMADALKHELFRADVVSVAEDGLTSSYGDAVEVREASIDGCTLAYAVVWSQWLQEWRFLSIDREPHSRREPLVLGTAIGGVRVTEDAPGYSQLAGIAAMSNVTGKGAPRTNVARSAIERTEEYDQYLQRVYEIYLNHIDHEMSSLETDRSTSATRAASEGFYMLQDVAQAGAIESAAKLRTNAIQLPYLVVEDQGIRERKSLEEISRLGSVWTVEGTAVDNFERVLGTIRGVSSPSLGALATALGVSDSLRLPEGALICGLPSARAYGGRLFAEQWDPVAFETDDESRVLRARWQTRASESAWAEVHVPKSLPRVLQERFDAVDRMRPGGTTDVCVPTGPSVEVSGITQSVVRCQGRYFVLPRSPLLNIAPARSGIPVDQVRWAISFVLNNVVAGQPTRTRLFGHVAPTREARASFLTAMRDYGLYEIIDESSTVDAFLDPSAEVLDVKQWDRRSQAAGLD
ncbi:ATP-binding protein [Agrococcus sp. Marseille-Q4369]|uniref:HD domain-containing protein n=1 Tax=Agrococcus sp. Marseille-Q4369 TaxID=2810513 RepID=UPI001B8AC21A|nr:ATP-binding protein [Agrococcus sp. Marseille-Q4369]QUW19403.1 ATP-binding protein [Agrococcus sp. Marseille-Q4369]